MQGADRGRLWKLARPAPKLTNACSWERTARASGEMPREALSVGAADALPGWRRDNSRRMESGGCWLWAGRKCFLLGATTAGTGVIAVKARRSTRGWVVSRTKRRRRREDCADGRAGRNRGEMVLSVADGGGGVGGRVEGGRSDFLSVSRLFRLSQPKLRR